MGITIHQPGRQPTARAKQQFLPVAREAANAVAVILARDYGNHPWILQCMDGIQQCVQNSIQMLSGAPVSGNNVSLSQGGQYTHKARTAEELKASQEQAAVGGSTSAATVQQQQQMAQADAALNAGNVDMFEVLQRQAGVADPASQQPEATNAKGSNEWIL